MKQLIIVLLILASAGTITFGQKKYQRPRVQTPTALDRSAPPAQPDPQSVADLKWFEVFQDEKLQSLIQEALTYNYDLRESVARVDAARANLGLTRSNQFPQIGATADFAVQGVSKDGAFRVPESVDRHRTFGSILLNLFTYELDVWGRLRKATSAARADLLATEEARRAVITTIVSDVATAYYNLRELDYELDIAKRTLTSREESLRLIRMRAERGVSNQLEVAQGQELVYEASEAIPSTEREIERQENFISLLTGKNPQRIERGLGLTEQTMLPSVPAGLSSELLARRPDIRSAEQQLIAASARIEVAKKAYFPTISITGFLGFESAQLTSLVNPSRAVWSVVPQIAQPIFTGGRIKSEVRLTQAQRDLLLTNYERTVQNAFREVADSLVSYRKVKETRTQREYLVATLQERVRLAYMRYNYGVSTLLEALDADRQLFDAELNLAQSRRDELLTVVQLYKALGGGWS